jgi:LPXTG-site transpeptidase (sortase) family protein
MLDLDAQLAQLVDEAATEVSLTEVRGRGRRRRTARAAIASVAVAVSAFALVRALEPSAHRVSVAATSPTTPEAASVNPARLEIAKIGLDENVVEGIDAASLKKGPAHDPASGEPGSGRNVVIVGRRTTYLHPFFDLDKLRPGDKVVLGAHAYEVRYSATIAQHWDALVPRLRISGDSLFLVTMTPKYSQAQTLIVECHAVAP